MPVYNSVLLDIDAKETRRYAGLNKAKDFDEKLIEEACLEARLLAEPRGIWQMYDYDAATQTVLADPPFTMKGKLIGKHLAKAQKVIVLSASIGDAIEEHVTKYFADGRYAYSVILDAAATAAVEQVADAMEKAIEPKVAKEGYTMRWRFSPGYGDWPLDQQPEMVRLAESEKIGVHLSDASMLVPRKSITAIIGLVPQQKEKEAHTPNGCAACDKFDCPSRKVPAGESKN